MIHEYFHNIDWLVVFAYLGLTTWVGHKMSGSQATIKDFFLGGRSLPWQAVSGSIIATEISGVTFIGVPGVVFALTGNFTYFQWAIGSVIARIIVGSFFVKVYYEREIYSPYDYMGNRLGIGVKRLATVIFSIGSILGQSVRVLVAAMALDVVTPWSFQICICIIGLFAIGWTLMGGMRTVIWTDVMQFALFTIGGMLALFWIFTGLDGGVGEFFKTASSAEEAGRWGKFTLLDLSRDPALAFTMWVALLAVPFQNLTAFGVDQLNAQRMFCCRSASDAKKAIIWSSVGQLLTLLMLMVGAALYVHYTNHGVSAAEGAIFGNEKDKVFPTWITTTLPIGLRGLILAGIFAAAISSLDSILAALSQTTLALFVDPDKAQDEAAHGKLVRASRLLVIGWGIALSAFAILLNSLRGDINMVNLAFGMAAYTVGPMLGLFLAALLWPRSSGIGLGIGVALSFFLTMYIRTDVQTIYIKQGVKAETIAKWGAHKVSPNEFKVVDLNDAQELRDNLWKKVVLRGTVESVEPPPADVDRLDAWPRVKFAGSDAVVFIGHSEKKKQDADPAELLEALGGGGPIAFNSEIFPHGDGDLVGAMISLKDGKPVLRAEPEAFSQDNFASGVALNSKLNYVWMYPLTCILTVFCGIVGGALRKPDEAE